MGRTSSVDAVIVRRGQQRQLVELVQALGQQFTGRMAEQTHGRPERETKCHCRGSIQ